MTHDLQALALAGLRDVVLVELQRRGLDSLAKLAALSDDALRTIPNVGAKAFGIIKAAIAADQFLATPDGCA